MSSRRAVALAVVVLTTVLAPAALSAPVAADPSVSVDYDGDRITVANGTSQVISGTADARKGTEVIVRVRATGETSPKFLKTASGVVTEDGTWAVAFDFSQQSAGDTFTLNARLENGSAETEIEGETVTCEGDCAETPPSGTPTPIPEQTQTPTRTDGPDAPVAFGENIFLVEANGVAAIPIAFDGEADSDTAVLVLGNESVSNYELEAVVRDDDGDGQAVVYFDSSLAGRGGETLSTSGGDSVRVRSETALDSRLDPANYDVSLYAGDERTEQPVDVGSLVVQTVSSPTPADTPADGTESPGGSATGTNGNGFGSLAMGTLVSGVFLVGGAVLAAVLLKT